MMSSIHTHTNQRKTTLTVLISKVFHLWPIYFIIYGIVGLSFFFNPWFSLPLLFGLIGFFKGDLESLYIFGPMFWITRKSVDRIGIGIGTMHQVTEPWRKGKGIYITIAKRTFLIGFCKRQKLSETEGILSAVQGRYLDTPPSEIGAWGNVEKESA